MNLEFVNEPIIEKLDINLIVAVTKNMVIGINDKLPWTNLKDDMLNFKNTTTGNIVIMGFKTWDSFGKRPLPNRINIVITSKDLSCSTLTDRDNPKNYDYSHTYFVNSIKEALDLYNQPQVRFGQQLLDNHTIPTEYQRKIFVIGGGTIYKQFLEEDLVTKMFITVVDTEYQITNEELENNSIVYFQDFDMEDWIVTEELLHKKSERNDFDFSIETYERKLEIEIES